MSSLFYFYLQVNSYSIHLVRIITNKINACLLKTGIKYIWDSNYSPKWKTKKHYHNIWPIQIN